MLQVGGLFILFSLMLLFSLSMQMLIIGVGFSVCIMFLNKIYVLNPFFLMSLHFIFPFNTHLLLVGINTHLTHLISSHQPVQKKMVELNLKSAKTSIFHLTHFRHCDIVNLLNEYAPNLPLVKGIPTFGVFPHDHFTPSLSSSSSSFSSSSSSLSSSSSTTSSSPPPSSDFEHEFTEAVWKVLTISPVFVPVPYCPLPPTQTSTNHAAAGSSSLVGENEGGKKIDELGKSSHLRSSFTGNSGNRNNYKNMSLKYSKYIYTFSDPFAYIISHHLHPSVLPCLYSEPLSPKRSKSKNNKKY